MELTIIFSIIYFVGKSFPVTPIGFHTYTSVHVLTSFRHNWHSKESYEQQIIAFLIIQLSNKCNLLFCLKYDRPEVPDICEVYGTIHCKVCNYHAELIVSCITLDCV